VKDAEVIPVGTTQVDVPGVEKVITVGAAVAGELMATRAIPSIPNTKNAAVAVRPMVRRSFGFTVLAFDSRINPVRGSETSPQRRQLKVRGAGPRDAALPVGKNLVDLGGHNTNRSAAIAGPVIDLDRD
jgi:hypothetical protein